MGSTWALAIFMWAAVVAVLVGVFVWESRKTPEQKKRDAEEAQARWEKARQAERIVEVRLLDTVVTQSKRGGVRGAMLGAFFGGVAGAAVAAALPSTKTKQLRVFVIKYGDGREVVRRCAQGSSEYKAWLKRVKK